MKTINNTILDTDSYKYSQFNQHPPQTEGVFLYVSARGPSAHSTSSVFFGLQAFLMRGFSEPIRMEHVDEAEQLVQAHGLPFYRGGWEQIVKKHGGYLPVSIRAVPEGSVVGVGNVLLTIENTAPHSYWLTSFLETALLRAIWYPTTVATNSYEIKKLILSYLIRTGDPNLIDFKLHDFGSRGVSSRESAMLGGMAHLVNFKGTDTVAGLIGAREYYREPMAGFSIPAMEHSTVTSWGRDAELDSFRNMMDLYAKEGALLACVSDSYDIFAAARAWATELREQVVKSGATVVIRPDSGDPVKVVLEVAKILAEGFGTTTNSKGFRVLKHVRIIQGDGVSYDIIDRVLSVLEANGFSADNVAFGQGGGLLQNVTRDDLKFAMKCSAVNVGGEWRDVYKAPVTDSGKHSLRGRLQLIKGLDGEYQTVPEQAWNKNELREVFRDGEVLVEDTFAEVRARANRALHTFFSTEH